MKKFSVLIAHYNNFKYFQECYNSILKQTYGNFEVIIVDDASIDDSLQKIRYLTQSDPKVKIYENECNRGVGFTKKKCVDLANGEICGFVDPDDALTNDALSLSVAEFDNNQIVASYSQLYFCDENLSVEKVYEHTHQIKTGNSDFLNINFEIAHFFCFSRAAYLKTEGLDVNYRVAEDQDLILKLYEVGDFKFIKKPLYFYRIHKNGLSHDSSKTDLRQKTWDKVLKSALKRRGVHKMYKKPVSEIENIPAFIFKKNNSIFAKILRKIS